MPCTTPSSPSIGITRCRWPSNSMTDPDHEKRRGISNHAIETVLRGTCRDFRGVFSSNTIPSCLLQHRDRWNRFSIVCNLSEVNEPGTHFVSIIAFPSFVLYLDSLGQPCTVTSIVEFLRQLKKPVFYNTRQIQDVSSDFCGLYCILFVLHFNHRDDSIDDPSLSTAFKWKTRHLLLNDLICAKKLRELLNKVDGKLYSLPGPGSLFTTRTSC